MAATYGQLKDGKRITFDQFYIECEKALKGTVSLNYCYVLLKRLYNKGYSVEDACSYLIMHS